MLAQLGSLRKLASKLQARGTLTPSPPGSPIDTPRHRHDEDTAVLREFTELFEERIRSPSVDDGLRRRTRAVVPLLSIAERLEFARKLAESPSRAEDWLKAQGF